MDENNTTPTPQNMPPKKPMNPEMESVSVNQPTPKEPVPPVGQAQNPSAIPGTPLNQARPNMASGVAPSKKIGKEQSTKSRQKFLVGCLGGFVVLFVIFIILMVFMVARSGASNPVMQAFGLDPSGIRNFLQGVVGFAFGLVSLLLLVMLVVGLFRFMGTQKSDRDRRRHQAKLMAFSSIALIVMIVLWVLLANYISRIEIQADKVVAEIVVVEPEDTSDLVAPVQIRFSALNVARALGQNGVQIESMNWDLDGDGQFETPVRDPEVTHLFNQKGTYTVGLQVKVAGEETYRPPYTVVISIPNAAFIATPSTGTPPLEVEFDASDIVVRENVSSLDWDFDGDGRFDAEGPNNLIVRHTFEQIGTYNVHLRVVDKNNNVQNYRRNIEVLASDSAQLSAQIKATPSLSGPQPLQINFNAEDSKSLKGNITNYEWNFGDGSPLESGRNTSKIFNEPGFYTVTLKVRDSVGNQAESSVEVEVLPASSGPQARITTTPAVTEEDAPLVGILPFKVMFSAAKSVDTDNDIVDYEWDFDGDGEIDETGEQVEYVFEEEGEFEVTLTLRDTENQADSTQLMVTVQNPGVQAKISANPEEGTSPLIVQFDGSGSSAYQGNIVSYEWDFGDGSPKTITGASVSHKYNAVGTYEVRLRVLTNNNLSASSTVTIFVREIPLRSCFTPSRTNGLAPLTVSFNSSCSTGAVAKYEWQFGDGDKSSSANPTHTFENPGTYTVHLEVTDSKNNVNSFEMIIVAEGDLN